MKVMILGDTHAHQSTFVNAFDVAKTQELDAIFQVGDFGFWPRNKRVSEVLAHVNRLIEDTGVDLYWLPGNHEDWHEYLALFDGWEYMARFGAMQVCPPAFSWTWDNVTFGSVGGAYSIDRRARVNGIDWFDEEVPQWEYLDYLPDSVDVLLSHEAPHNIARAEGWFLVNLDDPDLSEQSQGVVAAAIQKTNPALAVHGHWHWPGIYPFGCTKVVALDQASGNSIQDASIILDTEDSVWYTWAQYVYGEEGTHLDS